jgi:hypothetical protein
VTFTIQSNALVTGQEIGTVYANSTDECQQECAKISACRAFTLRPYSGNTFARCALFSSVTNTNPYAQGFTSGQR